MAIGDFLYDSFPEITTEDMDRYLWEMHNNLLRYGEYITDAKMYKKRILEKCVNNF